MKTKPPVYGLNLAVAVIQGALSFILIVYMIATSAEKDQEGLWLGSGEFLGPENSRTIATYDSNLLLGLLLVFTFVTCVFHCLYATNQFAYTERVKRGNNSMRWLEYSITATTMAAAFMLLSGVFEISAQILIVVAILCTMLCGDIVEKSLRVAKCDSNVITATVIGWLLMVAVIAVITKSFSENVEMSEEPLPWFVYAVFALMIVAFSGFGVIQLRDIQREGKGKPFNYLKLEIYYSAASVSSKTLLVLFIFAGVAARR